MPFTCSSWELCRAERATRAGADPGKSQTTSPVSQQLDSFAPGSPEQQLLAMWKKILVTHGGRLVFRAFFTVPSCRCGHVLNQMPLGGRSLMTHQGEEWGMIPLRQGGCQGTWMHGHCKTQTWAGFALLQTAVQAKQQQLQLHRPYCCIVKQLTIIRFFFSVFTLSDC